LGSAPRETAQPRDPGNRIGSALARLKLQEASMKKIRAIFVIAALCAVAAWGQDRTVWRTSADVQEGGRGSITGTVADTEIGRERLAVKPDDALNDQVTVDTDSVSTQYNGFGGTINGSPEIFVGSNGFNNVR